MRCAIASILNQELEDILKGVVDRCPFESSEDREPTFLELVDAPLAAIKAGHINAEMDSRRELKHQFRLSD